MAAITAAIAAASAAAPAYRNPYTIPVLRSAETYLNVLLNAVNRAQSKGAYPNIAVPVKINSIITQVTETLQKAGNATSASQLKTITKGLTNLIRELRPHLDAGQLLGAYQFEESRAIITSYENLIAMESLSDHPEAVRGPDPISDGQLAVMVPSDPPTPPKP